MPLQVVLRIQPRGDSSLLSVMAVSVLPFHESAPPLLPSLPLKLLLSFKLARTQLTILSSADYSSKTRWIWMSLEVRQSERDIVGWAQAHQTTASILEFCSFTLSEQLVIAGDAGPDS
ncbi:hypothetical protein ONZ45_g14682 [Pleurotus djamor]|nr:hypothetical protein ONZ45_g14682 [Pleurotus djamor]